MIASFQGELAAPSAVYQGEGLGDYLQLLRERERVQRTHVLIRRPCARGCVWCAAQAHVAQDHRRLGRTQLADALLQSRRRIVAADRRCATQDFRAVFALHADGRVRRVVRRLRDERTHFLAFEAGIAVVRGERALRQPLRSPQRDAQRSELAEVRGPLDRAALEAEFLRGLVVVDRGVIVVLLRGQHLPRHAQRSDQFRTGVLDRRCERQLHRGPAGLSPGSW